MAVIYPPRGQPNVPSGFIPIIKSISKAPIPESSSSTKFQPEMDEQPRTIPSNSGGRHGSRSSSLKKLQDGRTQGSGSNASPASAPGNLEPGSSKISGKNKSAVLPNRGGSSKSVGHSGSPNSQPLDAASAASPGQESTHSQAFESVSDLVLSTPAVETGSNQSQDARSQNSRRISAYREQALGNYSTDWDSGSGIELHVHKLGPATTLDAKNTLIKRRGSTRLSPDDYRPLLSAFKDPDVVAASRARIAMLEDWIHYHDFEERSTDALYLVDWSKVQPFERKSAVHGAELRARTALKKYVMLRDQLPVLQNDDEPINLKSFADTINGDASRDQVMDIDNLDLNDARFGSDSRLPRTIVVLAKVYHRILGLNQQLKDDARQWMLFLSWLSESPETLQRDPSELLQMGIGEHILKEGGCYIVKSINDQLSEYDAIRKSANDKFQIKLPAVADVNHERFGIMPQGCWDICKISPKKMRELSLYPQVEGNSPEQVRMLKQRLPGDFRRSLAFRAATLIQLRFMVIRARNIADTGVVEPEVECDDSEDDDDQGSGGGYSGVMGHGGR